MTQILIVEDETIIRTALRRLLERNNYQVSDAESVDQALENYKLEDFNLIITDLRLPGRFGTDLINLATNTPVLIMTSYASMKSAVDAMKQGAVDYIAKPFNHDEMLNTVNNIIVQQANLASQQQQEKVTASAPPEANQQPGAIGGTKMLGESRPMQDLYRRIQKVARTDATVLIQGESGTGKELAARSIHELSPRSQSPMISVNCAAIPESLIESELFGHEKGAFTGAVNTHNGLIEAADTGTLFLDEIGELPLEAQARLLRVLQEGEIRKVGSVKPMTVDIRLIAATHRDLKALTRSGQFREDLFYRLYIMEIRMPPLRERGKDILSLAESFLKRNCNRMHRPVMHFSNQARQIMLQYSWPGNVRELENAVERAVILCEDNEISPDLLSLETETSDLARLEANVSRHSGFSHNPGSLPRASDHQHNSRSQETRSPDLSLEDYFQRFVLENQDKMTETELAKRLGISRKTLWERRQRLGIPRKARS
ncbi:sigma-54 dependent transcriptional regulator [Motiliproteus sp. MSK22-1]|uniref:sigma-54-dependent transcriptional regulator n=1 Tax=Motiliproteus sp. MSK22-1 TaxID=1897630 RepID=UPI000977BC0D|nr:sigma-54 dependent transcriptional regulator [Motiliproteus sp. MSK22-1]OMH32048.1 Fis family transcriptional regulator [Motiliproteus sp. MSK22-1]